MKRPAWTFTYCTTPGILGGERDGVFGGVGGEMARPARESAAAGT